MWKRGPYWVGSGINPGPFNSNAPTVLCSTLVVGHLTMHCLSILAKACEEKEKCSVSAIKAFPGSCGVLARESPKATHGPSRSHDFVGHMFDPGSTQTEYDLVRFQSAVTTVATGPKRSGLPSVQSFGTLFPQSVELGIIQPGDENHQRR